MFNHLDAGTSEEHWLAASEWPRLKALSLVGVHTLLVLAAHPDDETLGAAGLMARANAEGIATQVILATDGEGSHPRSRTRTPAELGAIRRAEVTAALAIAAPTAGVDRLEIADGQVSERQEWLRERILQAISAAVDGSARGAGGLLMLAPWRGDGHRDHAALGAIAASAAAEAGVRLLEYPIWMWHWATADDPRVPWPAMLRLRLSAGEREVKARAMSAHASQTRALSDRPGDEALLNPEVLRHFGRDFEVFIDMHGAGTGSAGAGSAEIDPPGVPGEPSASLAESFFDAFYAGKRDPWGFKSRWYEERKRAITVASLPRRRFAHCLEVGCSTGVLTAELATRANRVLGIDIARRPLDLAREALQGAPHVQFARMASPRLWPSGRFDLIVLSEVGYYWSESDLRLALDRVVESLTAEGILLACHWRHDVAEYPLSGDDVHAAIRRRAEFVVGASHTEEDFVLEVFSRPPAFSVARDTGLLK